MKDVDKRILLPCLSVRGLRFSDRSSAQTDIRQNRSRTSFLPPIEHNIKLQRSEASKPPESRGFRPSPNLVVMSERNMTDMRNTSNSIPVRMDTRNTSGRSKSTCIVSKNMSVLNATRLPVNPIAALKRTANSLAGEHVPLSHLNKNTRTRVDDEGVKMRRLPVRLIPLEMLNNSSAHPNHLTSRDLKPLKRPRTKRI